MSPPEEVSLVSRLIDVWDSEEPIPSLDALDVLTRGESPRQQADAVLVDQRYRWQHETPVKAEEYLARFPRLAEDVELRLDIVYGEFRVRGEEATLLTEFIERFPEFKQDLVQQMTVSSWMNADTSLPQTNDADETLPPANIEDNIKTFDNPLSPATSVEEEDENGITKNSDDSSGANYDPAPLQLSDFELQASLGKGAMGEVHRAIQKSLNKPVAVKLLHQRRGTPDGFVERFLREARATASLKHPNVVGVHGVGRCPDGGYFLVMDLVDGQSLQAELEAGPMEFHRAAEITAAVASALRHVHKREVIHRDLKPGNVLCTPEGEVVVVDFGLARLLNSTDQQLTVDGDIIGTPSYMAPEQVDASIGTVTPVTDIYGLGGIFYAMLTGTSPIAARSTIQAMAEVLSERPVKRPSELRDGIPPELEAICVDCLQKKQKDRPQSAALVEERLLNWLQQSNAPDSSIKQLGSPTHSSQPNRLLTMPRIVACLLGLLIMGIIYVASRPSQTDGKPASGVANANADSSEQRIKESTLDTNASELPENNVAIDWDIDVIPKESTGATTASIKSHVSNEMRIRLNVSLAESRYVYAYWVGSDGNVEWIDDDGPPQAPVAQFAMPATPGFGFPISGPAGTEVCLLLVRNSPLKDPRALESEFEPVKPLPALDSVGVLADGRPLIFDSKASETEIAMLSKPSRALGAAEPLFAGKAGTAIAAWKDKWPQGRGHIHYLAIPHRDE